MTSFILQYAIGNEKAPPDGLRIQMARVHDKFLAKIVNPQAPVADELIFRRFPGEGVDFFKIRPH